MSILGHIFASKLSVIWHSFSYQTICQLCFSASVLLTQQNCFEVEKGMLLIIAGGIFECLVQLGIALFLFRLQLGIWARWWGGIQCGVGSLHECLNKQFQLKVFSTSHFLTQDDVFSFQELIRLQLFFQLFFLQESLREVKRNSGEEICHWDVSCFLNDFLRVWIWISTILPMSWNASINRTGTGIKSFGSEHVALLGAVNKPQSINGCKEKTLKVICFKPVLNTELSLGRLWSFPGEFWTCPRQELLQPLGTAYSSMWLLSQWGFFL